jgi:hypothetical protein
MSNMLSNYVNINPADDHALYTCLFAPIDEDGDPIMVVPLAPTGGGVPPGPLPVLPGMVVPLIPVPDPVHPNAALLAAALAISPRLLRLLLRLLLEVQLQSIPLNSNRHSLQHTINSHPDFRPWKKALQMGIQR